MRFYKNHKSDVIFWVDNKDTIGEHLFTFDKVKIYNLFADYPHNLTAEEKKYSIKKILIGAIFSKGSNIFAVHIHYVGTGSK